MNPIYALWCHPRSLSTAFERVMRERGDLQAVHEPFMYDYYITKGNRLYPHFEPSPEHPQSYREIRAMLLGLAEKGPVFLKDMAYYVVPEIADDLELMGCMKHAFLVRDPAEALVSYAKLDPDFTLEEAGFEAQWWLYSWLKENGCDPFVIPAQAVQLDPAGTMSRYWSHVGLCDAPHALEWDASVPEGWEHVSGWHRDTITSGAIRPPETGRDYQAELRKLGEKYLAYHAHHRPFYDKLIAEAEQ
jgi:hypothetical protein